MGVRGFPLLVVVATTLFFPSVFTLSTNYYYSTCPNLISVVRPVIQAAIARETRTAASIVRLFFHDCFVNGCDGSLLLNDTPTFVGEQTAPANNGSIRRLEVVEQIKVAVEKACPGVVSCADILALAASESVEILGGPKIPTKFGRLDARTASINLSAARLPPPFFNLSQLIRSFTDVGLALQDVVALSGAHTIGLARCVSFRAHIWNDTDIHPSFALSRRRNCPGPQDTLGGDTNLAPLDLRTPALFDNYYFVNLLERRGLLHSDQELWDHARGGPADALVQRYAASKAIFFANFVTSMLRMGDIQPQPGTPLEVRRTCGKVN